MTREPVYLTDRSLRMTACAEMIASLLRHDVQVIVLSVDRVHFHLLARFPAHDPRKFVGIAKKDSSRFLTDSGAFEPGGIWAKKSECVPVKNRGHQLKAAKYIADHYKKGAVVWSIPALQRLVPPASRCALG
jgi:REP element-mobilizing transposase RayT